MTTWRSCPARFSRADHRPRQSRAPGCQGVPPGEAVAQAAESKGGIPLSTVSTEDITQGPSGAWGPPARTHWGWGRLWKSSLHAAPKAGPGSRGHREADSSSAEGRVPKGRATPRPGDSTAPAGRLEGRAPSCHAHHYRQNWHPPGVQQQGTGEASCKPVRLGCESAARRVTVRKSPRAAAWQEARHGVHAARPGDTLKSPGVRERQTGGCLRWVGEKLTGAGQERASWGVNLELWLTTRGVR